MHSHNKPPGPLLPTLVLLFLLPTVSSAEEGLLEGARELAGEAWEASASTAKKGAEWTGEKAEQGWDSTKTGANTLWKATREGGEEVVDWSASTARDGAEATGKGADNAWQKTKGAAARALEWTANKSSQAAEALTEDEKEAADQSP